MFNRGHVLGSDKLYVEDVFAAHAYVGTGSALSIVNGLDLAGKGGMVWNACRSAGFGHAIFDTERGVTNALIPSSTGPQNNYNTSLTAFNANGFSLGNDGSLQNSNRSGEKHISWAFRQADKFFKVVTYTGNGANRAITHSLGVAPGMIMIKRLDTTGNWITYHRALGGTKYLTLNTTGGEQTYTYWNNTAPTASSFSLGADAEVNASGGTYVAYLFAHDTAADGIIQCGNFTGASSTINLGWEPQYILLKNMTSGGYNWVVYDTARGLTLGNDAELNPNVSNAEWFGMSTITPLATGFSTVSIGPTGDTYIYMAIRKGNMRTPTGATKVFAPVLRTGTGTTTPVLSGNIKTGVDLAIVRSSVPSPSAFATVVADRLRGPSVLLMTHSTAPDASAANEFVSFDMNGVTLGYSPSQNVNYSPSYTYINYFLKQARGFFDIVGYTGTGSAHTEAHNLGVVPELIIVKCRDTPTFVSGDWAVYAAGVGATKALTLNNTDAQGTLDWWNDTAPTSSVFSVKTNGRVNENTKTYIAYLFASCPGVSKIGTYTGNATTNQINCGFSAGARFVLIKRIDSTGDWYFWDTTRGIINGNDPYLLLNSITGEVTSTDYIDPYSAGFEISASAPAAINASGGSFLYMALA